MEIVWHGMKSLKSQSLHKSGLFQASWAPWKRRSLRRVSQSLHKSGLFQVISPKGSNGLILFHCLNPFINQVFSKWFTVGFRLNRRSCRLNPFINQVFSKTKGSNNWKKQKVKSQSLHKSGLFQALVQHTAKRSESQRSQSLHKSGLFQAGKPPGYVKIGTRVSIPS